MSAEVVIIVLFLSLLFFLALGLPIAFITGGIGVTLMLLLWGPHFLVSAITNSLNTMGNYLYAAIPLFIFMGTILESSGIAEDLYTALHAWLGGIRGGLAMGTVVICTIFAAMVGVAGAEVVTMGLIALPNMLKYKYDQRIACGTILAGGTLGQLIPPSLLFIVYGAEAGVSIGSLFKGGVPAGLIISILLIAYIGIRSFLQKDLCPIVPPEERPGLRQKIIYLKALVLPAILIFAVLGSIVSGIATPFEAASVGAVGAALAAVVNRRFSWKMIIIAMTNTIRSNCMIMWILIGAKCFATVMIAAGGIQFIQGVFASLALGEIGSIILMVSILFVLGMFLDPPTIIIVTVPIYIPIVKAFGLDPVWFGVLYIVNLQLSYITPPFGPSIFYLKGVAPDHITLDQIYASVTPFVLTEIVAIVIMIMFPSLILWII